MRRCLFLDRDGVINVAPPRGEYIVSWDEFHLLPAAVDWIRLFLKPPASSPSSSPTSAALP